MIARLAMLLVPLLLLSGCEKAMQDMYEQPKDKTFEPSSLFANGNSSRPLPPGVVPRSGYGPSSPSSGRIGAIPLTPNAGAVYPRNRQGAPKTQYPVTAPVSGPIPVPVTRQLVERGRNRYDIYCAPCHSAVGDGDGVIPNRGFPYPPSYHTARLRNAPDSHFYNVITNGYGVMYPYRARVAPKDRWAIVAYIRALQLSQYAPLADVPPNERARLQAPEGRDER